MFVVMLHAIKKPSFTFHIAQYPSANLTGSSLYPIVLDTIEALERNDIHVHVVSITCDAASSNHNFYILINLSAEKGDIPYKVETPIDHCNTYISFVMLLIYSKQHGTA